MRLYTRATAAVPPGAKRRFAKLTETFLAEIGVLLFVFPVLDAYTSNPKAVTISLLFGSAFLSIVFFAMAATIAIFTRDE